VVEQLFYGIISEKLLVVQSGAEQGIWPMSTNYVDDDVVAVFGGLRCGMGGQGNELRGSEGSCS
jgi:hypothetical protein